MAVLNYYATMQGWIFWTTMAGVNRCQKTVSCLNCSDRESQNCLEFLNSTTIKRQSFPFNSSPSTFFFCKWRKNTNLGGLFASWTESLHFVQTLKIDKTSQDLHRDNHNKSLKDNKYSHTTKFPLHPRQGHSAMALQIHDCPRGLRTPDCPLRLWCRAGQSWRW